MIMSVVSLVVLVALVAGIVAFFRQAGTGGNGGTTRSGAALRLYLYVMAYGGVIAVLFAAAGTLSLVLEMLLPRSVTILSTGDTIARTSLYLAALVVGLPVWLGHSIFAERRARTAREVDSPQRQLYFAAVYLTTSLVVLFALEALLRFLLAMPAGSNSGPSARSALGATARLLVYGGAWAGHAWWRRRTSGRTATHDERDGAHDLAVFILTGSALVLLLIGVAGALREVIRDVLTLASGPTSSILAGPPGGSWTIWAPIVARIATGGMMWMVNWQYDLTRGGNHPLRIPYLYLVLLVSAPTAISSTVILLYEIVRRLFGDSDPQGMWTFLRDVLPILAVSGATWMHHWGILRTQREPWEDSQPGLRSRPQNTESPSRVTSVGAASSRGIAWPRRPAIALLTVLGVGVAAPGFVAIIWVGLDFLLNTTGTVVSPAWWRDRLSLGLAATAVGGIVWLGAWNILESAAIANPRLERAARERRLAVGAIVLVSALMAIGFLIAVLWLLFRTLLGDSTVQNTVSWVFKDVSTVVVAVVLAGYHAYILRGDSQVAGPRLAADRVRLVVFAAPDAGEMVRSLRDRTGAEVEVAGHLDTEAGSASLPYTYLTLDQMVDVLTSDTHPERVLVLLYPAGGCLLPYRR